MTLIVTLYINMLTKNVGVHDPDINGSGFNFHHKTWSIL